MTKSEIYKCHYYDAIHFDGILKKNRTIFFTQYFKSGIIIYEACVMRNFLRNLWCHISYNLT